MRIGGVWKRFNSSLRRTRSSQRSIRSLPRRQSSSTTPPNKQKDSLCLSSVSRQPVEVDLADIALGDLDCSLGCSLEEDHSFVVEGSLPVEDSHRRSFAVGIGDRPVGSILGSTCSLKVAVDA